MDTSLKHFPAVDVGKLSEREINEMADTFQELRHIQKDAEKTAIKEFYLKIHRKKIKLKMQPLIPDSAYAEDDELTKQLAVADADDDDKYCAFVTVNPQHNNLGDFDALRIKTERCVAKRWVTQYQYCYEQRSTDAAKISGLHVHLLILRTIRPSHMEREIRSTFASLVGIPKKHIHISWKKKKWVQDKLDYMAGLKTGVASDDVKKCDKTPIDTIMREKLNIKPIYGNWPSDIP